MRCPAGFLFRTAISIELGDHNAVTETHETSADLVLVSPKFEGPPRRPQSAQDHCALSG
jgi:hypothetical protein